MGGVVPPNVVIFCIPARDVKQTPYQGGGGLVFRDYGFRPMILKQEFYQYLISERLSYPKPLLASRSC